MKLTINVVGRPAPQGSHDLGGAGQFLDQSAYLPAWRTAVRIAAFRAYADRDIHAATLPLFPAGTPVVFHEIYFFMGPDQCRAEGTDLPIGKPDVDKLLRGLLDALGGGRGKTARLYADDSQVVGIKHLAKIRATGSLKPGASIVVSDGRE